MASLMAGNPVEKPKQQPTIATRDVNRRIGVGFGQTWSAPNSGTQPSLSPALRASNEQLAIVVGVGPGIGASVSRRFAKEGLLVCMIARSNQFVDAVAKEIEAFGGKSFVVLADASVPDSFNAGLDKALEKVSAEFPLQAVVYNAAARIESPFLKLDARRLETSYRLNQLAPWILCQRAAPIMVSQGFGSILVTGATASIRGNAGFTCFASTKAALRTFCQSLAKELGPNGIHVAHFIIDGGVANSRVRHVRKDIDWSKLGTSMDPDSIADEYWHTHMQHWSSWTFELDLRPFSEKF